MNQMVDECLVAIGDHVGALQAVSLRYQGRALDWGDVASLRELRDRLGVVVSIFGSAGAADEMRRAAGEVAVELRPRRD